MARKKRKAASEYIRPSEYNWINYSKTNDIHARTEFLVEALGPNQNAFAIKTGIDAMMIYYIISKSQRRQKSIPNFNFIYKVLRTFPQVSPRWYILGEGMWNSGNLNKKDNEFNRMLNEARLERDKYKKLYAQEKFINDALRAKINKRIRLSDV